MHDERVGARALDCLSKMLQRLFRVLIVDADAALDRNGNRYRGLHRGNAVADEAGLGHQAGAKAAFLHPVGRATDVEIDLVETQIGADARARRKRPRNGAAKLQRQRMLGRSKRKSRA